MLTSKYKYYSVDVDDGEHDATNWALFLDDCSYTTMNFPLQACMQRKNHKANSQQKKILFFVATNVVAAPASGFGMLNYVLFEIILFFFLLSFFRVHARNLFSTGNAEVKPEKNTSEKQTAREGVIRER